MAISRAKDKGKVEPKTEEEIASIVKHAVEESIDFIEEDIAQNRNKCQRYYEGKTDLGHEEGRSKVVATKVRDTVRVILPNLMRIFLGSEFPVEYQAKRREDVQSMDQATRYVASEFERMDGFRLLLDVMNDAIVKKVGFIKAWWDEEVQIISHKFTNLTDDELALLTQDDSIEIKEQETETQMVPDPQTGAGVPISTHSVTLDRIKSTGKLCMDVIPSEDFFIDNGATCWDDAYCYGYQSEMRVADLVAQGFDYNEIVELGSASSISDDTTDEKYEREYYTTEDDIAIKDPSMKLVTVVECFMRLDLENDGEARMHKCVLMGKERKLMEYEPWDHRCIAAFECDPQPHLFFGWSVPDILFDEQDAATSMLRGILDNIALTNDPRTEVNDENVNMDDMLNNEIGNLVRVKMPGQINPLAVPFVAGDTLGAVQYFDAQIESKTGINQFTGGLDSNVLQNVTATGVSAAQQAGSNQLEAIARNIAQGYADLFGILLRLIVENSDEEVFLRMGGDRFVQMDPRSWNLDNDVKINVGLGTGREMEKQTALSQVLDLQLQMNQAGVTDLPEPTRNTVADMLAISGLRNIDRYFPQPDPMAQQQGQGAPQEQGGDPGQAIVAGEQIRAQASMQEKMAQLQVDMKELEMKDDLERDKMAQDLMVKYAEILGQYGTQVDLEVIKGAQQMPRGQDPMAGPGNVTPMPAGMPGGAAGSPQPG